MEHFVHVESGEALNLGVHPCLRVHLLRHTDVLLILLAKRLEVQRTVRGSPNYGW